MIGVQRVRPLGPGAFSRHSLRSCRVDQSADGGDAIRREASPACVFPDRRFVRSEVDAVHLVTGYVAMEPVDLGTHSLKNVDRLLACGWSGFKTGTAWRKAAPVSENGQE